MPILGEADSSRHAYSEFTCFAAVGLELGQPCLCTEWMWELLVNSGLLHSLSHCSGCPGLPCFIYFGGGGGGGEGVGHCFVGDPTKPIYVKVK